MEVTKPKGITTTTTWNLDLEQAHVVASHLDKVHALAGKLLAIWRSIRVVDAGDGHDVTLTAFQSLEQPEQNKAMAYALYALHSEFVTLLGDLNEEVSALHNQPWETLFQAFTATHRPEQDNA